MRKSLILLLIALSPVTARAADIRFEAGAGGAEFLAAVQDHPVPGGRAGLGVCWHGGPGAAVHLRYSTTWGPLGNVVADFDAAVTPSAWSVLLAGRAVVGPVSLRLRGGTWNTGSLPRLRAQDAAFPPRFAAFGEPLHAFEAGVTYRVSRDMLVLADAAFKLTGDSTELRHMLEVRMPRMVHGHELRLLSEALHRTGPRGSAEAGVWSAFGIGLHLDRQRASPWTVILLLGGAERFAPGFRITVAEGFGPADLRIELRAEPWRTDLSGLSLDLAASGPLSGGTVRAGVTLNGWPAEVRAAVSYSLPFE